MAAYYSQNAPLVTPYQTLPSESPNDDGPASIPAIPTGGPSTTNDENLVAPESAELPRRCSVRGCVSIIPADSTNKMCEACRGRHRVYATTKRAKRKMEKEALTQQSVGLLSTEQPPGTVWLPENPELDDEPRNQPISGARETSQIPVQSTKPASHASNSTPVSYSVPQPAPWDHTVLDPCLVSSQSSELAGALTLPTQPASTADATHPKSAENTSAFPQDGHTSSLSQGAEEGPDSHDVDAPYVAPARQGSSTLPSRYCSVKGCKALIPSDYFFKMCEPCRDRYRGYGITKRAKWRAERVAANAELEALRVEEDKRRADEGLPPLAESPEDWIAWQNDLVEGPLLTHTEDKYGPFPARMCTVSHCHAILPGQYKYRRCEQHRLQNRHHSKLKRVREKEVKAQVAALASAEPNDEFRIWAPRGESSKKKDEDVAPLFTNVPMELDRNTREESGDGSEGGDEAAESPSAIGGARRTNHVCSIKGCHNLLAPNVPWKMCDICREHDRENRKNKKLRDLGELPPLRFQTNIGSLKKGGKLKSVPPKEVIGSSAGTSQGASSSPSPVATTLPEDSAAVPNSARTSSSNDADEVFTDLLYSEGATYNISSSGPDGDTGPLQQSDIPAPLTATDASGPTNKTSSNVTDTTSTAPESSSETQPRKKRGKRKAKDVLKEPPAQKTKSMDAAAATLPTDTPGGSNQTPVPFPYGLPYGTPMHPPYPIHYFLPAPNYNMPTQPPVSSMPASTSTSTSASAAQTTTALPAQQMYPQPYGHYHSYGPQQPYGQYSYSYLPPQYNPSQPHLQPYGSSVYPGQPSSSYGAPQKLPPQKPQAIKPVQRRKRRQDDQELPGPHGSTSYTSVFSARRISPAPTLDPKSVSNAETSLPSEQVKATSRHNADMARSHQCAVNIPPVNGATIRKCTNQSCHRDLPAGTAGAFCERCRERMKKRQTKAKHRFKLEPRKVIVRVGNEGEPAVGNNGGQDGEV